MPEEILKFRQRIAEFWNGLEKGQKIRIYITSIIVTLCVVLGLILLNKPNRITLIRDYDPKDIGEMSAILNENNIWNSIENNGTSIVINARDNNKAQVVLAQKGYPKSGMTFEDAISMIGMSTTESDKKYIWKQQKTADIESKLKMLDNIENASVILALPERSIFMLPQEEASMPTAYVMIKPKEKLTPKQVEAVVMIVSRSVENLKPENITVVDNNLNILNNYYKDTAFEMVNTQEEMRYKKTLELQNRVYEYFSVGEFDNFDTIRVVANPVLDFDTLKEQKKTISNPEGMTEGAVISSESTNEQLFNSTGEDIPAPGIDANPGTDLVDTPTYQIGEQENSSYSKQHDIRNYAYNETISETEKAVGVLIPEKSTMAISLWYGKRVTDQNKLSDEFLESVKIAASTATGIPVENISVHRMRLAEEKVEEVTETREDIIRELITIYGLPILGLQFAIIIVMIILIRNRKRKKQEEMVQAVDNSQQESAESPKIEESIPEIVVEEKSEIKKQLDKFVQQKPEAVAQLLKNWLAEDWDY
ncbi:MAG TPA: flagellar M-ring protein FliF [Clostridiaceae bacterium]|nr:flagellar M-ring protein FliF [Clostridiaceae bacterium]